MAVEKQIVLRKKAKPSSVRIIVQGGRAPIADELQMGKDEAGRARDPRLIANVMDAVTSRMKVILDRKKLTTSSTCKVTLHLVAAPNKVATSRTVCSRSRLLIHMHHLDRQCVDCR